MIFPIIRSQINNIVSATKAILETRIAKNSIKIILIIIINTKTILHYTNGNHVKANCYIDELSECRLKLTINEHCFLRYEPGISNK